MKLSKNLVVSFFYIIFVSRNKNRRYGNKDFLCNQKRERRQWGDY